MHMLWISLSAILFLWVCLLCRASWTKRKIAPHWKGFIVLSLVAIFVVGFAWHHHEQAQKTALAKTIAQEEEAVKKRIAQKKAEAANDFLEEMERLVAEVPGEVGICLYDPQEDRTLAVNDQAIFEMASIYKLYVAWTVLQAVDQGEITLGEAVPGWGGAVQDALRDMITWSDNDSAEALGEMVGWGNIEHQLKDKGFVATSFNPSPGGYYTNRLESTPQETVSFLRRLGDGELLDKERTAYFLKLLRAQEKNNTVSLGLPDHIHYGHKTGWLDSSFHDAGILEYKGKEYEICVMTTGWSDGNPMAETWYENVGKATADYIETMADIGKNKTET